MGLHVGVTVSCAYNYFVCKLKLVFFCILNKLSDYELSFPLQEHDGHFVFLICGCFGPCCLRDWGRGEGRSVLVFTLMVSGGLLQVCAEERGRKHM